MDFYLGLDELTSGESKLWKKENIYFKIKSQLRDGEINQSIYIYIYMCVCVCVCVLYM